MDAMKRLNSNCTISRLSHSAYNALRLSCQVKEEEKRILHFSYNLALDAEHEGYPRSIDEDGFGELTRATDSKARSQRVVWDLSQEQQNAPEIQRNGNMSHQFNDEAENRSVHPKARSQIILYGGPVQGYVHEKSTAKTPVIVRDAVVKTNASVANRRKYGLGEASNISLMSHKLRKKAVCDSTDNSHYQRQFLRVLNKRF